MPGRTGYIRRIAQRFVALAFSLAVAACGGGGGSAASPPPPTTPPPPPTVVEANLSISDAIVTEGNSGMVALRFTVTPQSITPSPSVFETGSVDYSTSGITATEGVDYMAASGTIQITEDFTSATIDIDIVGDDEIEVNETFNVVLSSPVNVTIADDTGVGTIRDDDSPTGASGLDNRPDNQTCFAPDRPTVDASISIIDPYPTLPNLVQPTKLLFEPGSGGRWFVLQKTGEIMTFLPSNPADVTEYMNLNIGRSINTNSEGGLLGMAFHPDYPATPEIFVSYTIDHTGPSTRSVVSRMVLDDIDSPGFLTEEQVIIEVDQDAQNHNGGDIAFGPDGNLYFGLGDGGGGNDPLRRSQDTSYLLGSMLRIDVIGTGADYNIPSDNRFAMNAKCGPGANGNDCPEIYAWGLRNPWRWSFDEPTGQLWLADVGQGAREEVDLIERNGNYGWPCREGTRDNIPDCGPGDSLIDPVTEYDRGGGNSITGGYVYRGSAIPELEGLYIFADYGSDRFWAARPDGQGGYVNDQLIQVGGLNPTAFAIGPDDELYFVNIDGANGLGRVRRIEPAGAPVPDMVPDLLSDTGCVDTADITQPYSGLLPYDLNAPFWSDGAAKDRYIGLPNGTQLNVNADGDFNFPPGTVIVKNFRLGGNLIETRHLMRHPDGVWAGYTYEWNPGQTEATRVRGGKVVNIGGQDWIYPSEGQCMECHTGAAGFALGPEIAQLNKDITYPATGRLANQLETMDHVMMFSAPLGSVSNLDQLSDPDDTGAPLEPRVRAYLHTNCAGCHRPNGPTPSTMDLRYATALADTNACDAVPLNGDLGISNARLIAPGNSARSLLVERMQRRDIHGMPPLGSTVIDSANVARVAAWIDGLANCN